MAAQKSKPAAKVATNPEHKANTGKADMEVAMDNAIGRTESFIYRHGKILLIVLVAIVLLIAGYLGYKNVWQANRADKASSMMFIAQQNFQSEIFEAALNGDGNNAGFLDIISSYSGTPEANLAKHYAGICYLKLDDQDNALKYLGEFDHTKGVPSLVVNAQNYGLQADIYVQKGDYDKAVELYGKAIKTGDDLYSSPMYLKKLGLTYEKLGRYAEAVEAYQSILDDYAGSIEAYDIEKYIGAAEQR